MAQRTTRAQEVQVAEEEQVAEVQLKSRQLFVTDISQDSAQEIIKQLLAWNDEDLTNKATVVGYQPPPITMNISSFGGCVYSLFAIISVLRTTIAPVITYARGYAMSAGFMLFLYGDVRVADKYAVFMIHDIISESSGTMQDIRNDIQQSEKLSEEIIKIVLEKTKIKKKDLEAKTSGKNLDWFMNSEEALSRGVATQVI